MVLLNQRCDRFYRRDVMLDLKELFELYLHDIFRRNNPCFAVNCNYLLGYLPPRSPGVSLKKLCFHYYSEPGTCLLPCLVVPGHCISKGSVKVKYESFDSGGYVENGHLARGNRQQ